MTARRHRPADTPERADTDERAVEPIAIIGLGCRFPGAEGREAFWRLLSSGTDAIREVPAERWDIDRFYDPDVERPGRMNTRWGGFLDQVDRFDPHVFGISTREAASMDPQQRLVLEVVWEALEDAGLARRHVAHSRTGVFIGVSNFDYGRGAERGSDSIDVYSGVGTALSIIANRVSYVLDLRGPSMALDTACSSSLVAVHLACRSLLAGESEMALAGGVNVMLGPEPTIAFSKARMMAEDGRCKAFDARADGYVRGEGAGVVVLKPLRRALADGDLVSAVIRGSAINQDGFSNGLTAPNPQAQEAVIREACRNAGVAPGELQYVEAHGTGTALGDPIEAKALGKVLSLERAEGDRCALGSVKTNIGHLESAAGIAGLIKVALALERREIPPSLHYRKPNPYIPFDSLPLDVQRELAPWPQAQRALAGVSSFGFGGTNAHMVLEGPPAGAPAGEAAGHAAERPRYVLSLSAKNETPLAELARRYEAHIANHPDLAPRDLCFNANARRSHFRHRAAITGANLDELRSGLAACARAAQAPGVHRGIAPLRRPLLAFLFTGQGSQYPDMGRALYRSEPVFRKTLERCDELLRPRLDPPLLSVLYGDETYRKLLHQTAYTQPALFALGMALTRLLASWGLRPDIVLGHSIGEYTAACVAGAFSLEQGLELVAERARLMQALPPKGAMAAVFAEAGAVAGALEGLEHDVSLAALNGPRNTVVSGEKRAVGRVVERLREKGVKVRPLTVSHAFHSSLVEPMLDDLETAAGRLESRPLELPLVSNLDGQVLEPGHLIDAAHWRRHTRAPVDFAHGIATLTGLGHKLFLELGPSPVLTGMARQVRDDDGLSWLATLRQGADDWRTLLGSLAELHVRGVEIDWQSFDAGRRMRLPGYPFERQRYWIGAEESPMTHDRAKERTAPATEAAPDRQGRAPSAPASSARPGASDTRRDRILARLRSMAGNVLWTESAEVDPQTPFIELGADSVVLIEFVTRIEAAFDLKLPLERLQDDLVTLAALTDYLDEALPPEWGGGAPPAPDPSQRPAAGGQADEVAPSPGASAAPNLAALVAESAGLAASGTADGDRDALAALFQRQLDVLSQVMAQQLEVLRRAPATPAEPSEPAAEAAPSTRPAASPPPAAAPRPAAAPPAASHPRQAEHLEDLARRYNRRTKGSKRYAAKHRGVLADRRAAAGFRPSIKEMLYPVVGKRAKGAHVWDVDGNDYVDLTMGFGVHLFGHSPAFVRRALTRQMETGLQLGPQAPLAGPVAELIAELTGAERVLFCNSGTEAVMTALRLARTATGRARFAMFAGAYHGHFDGTLALPSGAAPDAPGQPLAPGIAPHMAADALVLPWAAPEALATLRACAGELAAILVEPVQSRRPDVQPRDFLHELRRIATESGAALVFDEIITGFRAAPGGAQEWFDVQADLATYGKLVGGGLPIGIVAGDAAYLDGIDGGDWHYGDDSAPRATQTFFAGTFSKNPLTLAAARAVLSEIKRRGPALQQELNAHTEALVERLNHLFAEEEAPIRVSRFGSVFRFEFTGNLDVLFYHLLNQGLYLWEGRTCFWSTAHGEAEAARVLDAVRASVAELRAGGFLAAKRERPRIVASAPAIATPRAASGEVVSLNPDELIVKLAEGKSEIEQAQALRFRVFYEEMGAHPTADMQRTRRDFDAFDEACDHLLVIDRKQGDVVGTYRLLRSQSASAQRFYSADEYDISPLLALDEKVLELGRSCVAPQYRNGAVLQLLWQGIVEYVRRHRIELMFGCASFPGTDPGSIAEQLTYLYHYHLAPPAIRMKALPHRHVDMRMTDVAKIDLGRIAPTLPPIIRGYLRLGAFVGDGAVIDEQFNTTDVAVVLRAGRATRAFEGGAASRSLLLDARAPNREHAS